MRVTEGIPKLDGVTEISPVDNERENVCVHMCVCVCAYVCVCVCVFRERENMMTTLPHVIQGTSFQLLVLCPQALPRAH